MSSEGRSDVKEDDGSTSSEVSAIADWLEALRRLLMSEGVWIGFRHLVECNLSRNGSFRDTIMIPRRRCCYKFLSRASDAMFFRLSLS